MEANTVVKLTTEYSVPYREWEVLHHIAENPGILTGDINKFASTMKPAKYEFKKGVSQPHVELAKKGLVYSTTKGGRAKYWMVTSQGQRIIDDEDVTIKESDDLYLPHDHAGLVQVDENIYVKAFDVLCDFILPKITFKELTSLSYKIPELLSSRLMWKNLDEETKIAIEINGMDL